MKPINSAITDFYNNSSEDTRLQTGLGPLEFERNKQLISRHLKRDNLAIGDIGGGSGHYASWLAALGHRVTLLDPVEKHLTQAQKKSKRSKNKFECLLGEAGNLPFGDATLDIVILHGPLYHLQQKADRMAALQEAKRVLKKDGIMLGFAITHAASTLAALTSGMLYKPEILKMCKDELVSSRHEPPRNMPGMLASAYFHRPSALLKEFNEAGFLKTSIFAVEGMVWMDSQFFLHWNTPETRNQLLELIRLTESDEELLCFSPHIMVAGQLI